MKINPALFIGVLLFLASSFQAIGAQAESAPVSGQSLSSRTTNALQTVPQIWNQLNEARMNFQNRFYEIALKNDEELQELLETHRRLQLALLERRDLIYQYWSQNHPEKISIRKGIDDFLNFTWTSEDKEEFVEKIEGFSEVEERIERLRVSNNSNPKWEDAQDLFKRMQFSHDYLSMMQEMHVLLRRSERKLKAIVQKEDESSASAPLE